MVEERNGRCGGVKSGEMGNERGIKNEKERERV